MPVVLRPKKTLTDLEAHQGQQWRLKKFDSEYSIFCSQFEGQDFERRGGYIGSLAAIDLVHLQAAPHWTFL